MIRHEKYRVIIKLWINYLVASKIAYIIGILNGYTLSSNHQCYVIAFLF